MTTDGTTPEARIEIRGGRLAGTQIHLVASGNQIEARLLTGNAASRQTLIAAMETVREKLRDRGVRRAEAAVAAPARTSISDTDPGPHPHRLGPGR